MDIQVDLSSKPACKSKFAGIISKINNVYRKDVTSRLDTLFGESTKKKDEKAQQANGQQVEEEKEKPYETVNEGMTTDTTDISEESKRKQLDKESS